MARDIDFGAEEDAAPGWRRLVAPVIAVAVLLVVGLLVWKLAASKSGVTRAAPQVPIIALQPPPPPPPPPPPKEEPPKPTEVVKEAAPEPTPAPTPQPKAPAPAPSLAINGPAQAGSDAFGVQAGRGGGMTIGGDPNGKGTGPLGGGGNGFAESAYNRYLSALIQQAVQQDDRTSRAVFTAEVAIWIDGAGKITRANLLKTSGDGRVDKQLLSTLQGMQRFEEPPPASLRFPQRVTIRGRRA